MRQKLQVSWDIPAKDTRLKQFKRYIRDLGARQSTIDDYMARVGRYLEFCGKERPSPEMAQNFRDHLMDRELSRSTINNTCFAMRNFHKMLGQEVKFPFLKRSNTIPYWFTADEVTKIFDQINNIKHLAMFKTAFYG